MNHLTLDLLRQVQEGDRSSQELAALALVHLLELCPQCNRAFQGWRTEAHKPTEDASPLESDAAAGRTESRVPVEGESTAPQRIAELLTFPASEQAERLRREPQRFGGLKLASLLLEEVRSRLPGRLREAHAIACLARTVVQHGEQTPETTALYARAVAQEGNALRALGDLGPAEALLETARFVLSSQGISNLLAQAELDKLEGSLRRAQRQLDLARTLLERAAGTYAAAGLADEEARTLISLGMVWQEIGNLDKAVEVTTRAAELAQNSEDPRLVLYVQHNLANYHFFAGRSRQAREVLTASCGLYDRFGDPGTLLRRRWLEGRLAEKAGDLEFAEDLYHEVRSAFQKDGMAFMAAMVGKCLIALYARQRRITELEELTREIVAVFEELQVYPEADSARRFLEEATGAGSPTVH